MQKIVIIDGHPDPSHERLNHSLADHYEQAAREAGAEVQRIDVAWLDFPIMRDPDDFYEDETVVHPIRQAQRAIQWADHIAMFYPLWMSDMPAVLKAFMEQTFRPGVALN